MATAALVLGIAAPAAAHGDEGTETGVDETHLPIGETTTEPTVGGLWTCRETYTEAPGAQTEGAWINGDGTYDRTKKATVDGSVDWPNAKFTVTKEDGARVFTTNALPTDHTTGVFPVSPDDDAYQVDRNPNSISEQSISFSVPLTPTVADEPSCVGGEVGILKSGVALFNAVDAGGRDAVAYEVQDDCDGHPQQAGLYHYHSVSRCVLADLDSGTGPSKLIGWAFDGFGIYGPRDADGNELTSADLDECHGTTSRVKFNGKWQTIYHYVATVDYPYTVGCFRGTSGVQGPLGGTEGTGQQAGAPGAPQGRPSGPPPPPPGA
jgi:hypothetical protein